MSLQQNKSNRMFTRSFKLPYHRIMVQRNYHVELHVIEVLNPIRLYLVIPITLMSPLYLRAYPAELVIIFAPRVHSMTVQVITFLYCVLQFLLHHESQIVGQRFQISIFYLSMSFSSSVGCLHQQGNNHQITAGLLEQHVMHMGLWCYWQTI